GNRKTERTKVLFEKGGISYVYLCSGIHHLLNVVTNQEEVPHAVLIRAIKPLIGIEIMLKRRKKEILTSILTGGPGSLTEALGITRMHNRLPFSGPLLWIEDRGISFSSKQIIASPRIGVEYAQEDAYLPYRFQLQIDLFQNALCLD
ncbi:MAG: DNA-3-methyladenine glycosylase, partial [Simkania negevensis]|nr:DNA-3-methyladenine glycosylase [Simkania negevensis]